MTNGERKEFYISLSLFFFLEFYIVVIFSELLPLHCEQGDLHFYLVLGLANFVASWSWPILQSHYMFHATFLLYSNSRLPRWLRG